MSSARRSTALTLADAQASRPTSSPLAGKHDVCVKVMLTDSMADALRATARDNGFGSVSDFLRELIGANLYGEQGWIDLHADRIKRMAGSWAKKAAL